MSTLIERSCFATFLSFANWVLNSAENNLSRHAGRRALSKIFIAAVAVVTEGYTLTVLLT